MNNKITVNTLKSMKDKSEKITMLTAYDHVMARQLDESGIDIILVGDSVGNVLLGYKNTIPVTMDDMIHHCKAVVRGVDNSFVVGDMPFMSYQVSREEAVKNAGRFLKESGVEAVKLEGGTEVRDIVRSKTDAGIPVMAHLGLTPQSVHKLGGYGLRGASNQEAEIIMESAKALESAGAFAIILEKIPSSLSERITKEVSIPTIGIGAGPMCDGQVLVTHDMLGIFEGFKPKFVKRYGEVGKEMKKCYAEYIKEVKDGSFPSDEYSY